MGIPSSSFTFLPHNTCPCSWSLLAFPLFIFTNFSFHVRKVASIIWNTRTTLFKVINLSASLIASTFDPRSDYCHFLNIMHTAATKASQQAPSTFRHTDLCKWDPLPPHQLTFLKKNIVALEGNRGRKEETYRKK